MQIRKVHRQQGVRGSRATIFQCSPTTFYKVEEKRKCTKPGIFSWDKYLAGDPQRRQKKQDCVSVIANSKEPHLQEWQTGGHAWCGSPRSLSCRIWAWEISSSKPSFSIPCLCHFLMVFAGHKVMPYLPSSREGACMTLLPTLIAPIPQDIYCSIYITLLNVHCFSHTHVQSGFPPSPSLEGPLGSTTLLFLESGFSGGLLTFCPYSGFWFCTTGSLLYSWYFSILKSS